MKAIIKFLHEARVELAKVSWPTRSAVINLTLAVLFVGAVLTAYTAGVDYLMTQGVKWVTIQSEKAKTKAPTSVQSTPVDIGQVEGVTK